MADTRMVVLLVVGAVAALLLAALRVVSRDDHWLVISGVLVLAGISLVVEAVRVGMQARRRAAADGGQVDDHADADRFGDGVGEIDRAEG